MNNTEIKNTLIDLCDDILQTKIDTLEKLMNEAQDSANNETKSSAGDKYETSRAMMQNERDQHARQLAQAMQIQGMLAQIDATSNHPKVTFGSLVKTKLANYFIAIAAGRLEVEGQKYYVISPQAPLAVSMLQKSTGEFIEFNGNKIEILEVV